MLQSVVNVFKMLRKNNDKIIFAKRNIKKKCFWAFKLHAEYACRCSINYERKLWNGLQQEWGFITTNRTETFAEDFVIYSCTKWNGTVKPMRAIMRIQCMGDRTCTGIWANAKQKLDLGETQKDAVKRRQRL